MLVTLRAAHILEFEATDFGIVDHLMGAGIEVFGVFLTGSDIRKFWEFTGHYFVENGRRPVIFAGYNGIVLEKFEEGLAWRCGYDFIAMNSPADHRRATRFLEQLREPEVSSLATIGIRRGRENRPLQIANSTKKQIVFAEQVIFPAKQSEKFYLYGHLVRLAASNPQWEIVIRPRTLPEDVTFHRQRMHISEFLGRHFRLPSNLTISYQPLNELLEHATALISVSSTAFFDAITKNVPAFVISDFGLKNSYGTHYFHGSGCLINLGDLENLDEFDFSILPDEDWLLESGFSDELSPDVLVKLLESDELEDLKSRPPKAKCKTQNLMGEFPIEEISDYLITDLKPPRRSNRVRVTKYIIKHLNRSIGRKA